MRYLVCGIYFEGSLKEAFHSSYNFADDFLCKNENMQRLNTFLPRYFIDKHENKSQILVVSLWEGIASSSEEQRSRDGTRRIHIFLYFRRLIMHVINKSKYGIDQVVIRIGNVFFKQVFIAKVAFSTVG